MAASTNSTTEAYQARTKIEPVGRLHLERLEMKPAGIEKGELIYSVPLAPKESVKISHKEWSVKNEEFSRLTEDFFEGYSEEGVAEKTDISLSTDSQHQHSSALNISASGEAWGVTFSSSASMNSGENTSIKDSRNHSISVTRKASARSKKEHKISLKTSALVGEEDTNVRVITNPSDTNAIRIDYHQMVRKWKVDLIRYGLRMTYDIVVPNPASALMERYEQIYDLDQQIEEYNFDDYFNVKINALDPDNENSWKERRKNIKQETSILHQRKKFKRNSSTNLYFYDYNDDKDTGFWGSYQFEITPGYEL